MMNRSKNLDTIAPDDPIIPTLPKPKTNKPTLNPSSIKKISKSTTPPKDEITQRVYDILGHTKTPFSAFLVRPKIFSFSERGENEEIYLASRPHWINNLQWLVTAIFMLFVPLLFHYFSFLNFFPPRYQLSAVLFWYIFTFIFAFEKFLSWYFNVFLITNERVVDIDFNNLLNRHFAEADLSAIQDVSSSVKGILGTFFNYGDVLIQTAAEINKINFEKVPNPEKIIKLIKELRDLNEGKGDKHV